MSESKGDPPKDAGWIKVLRSKMRRPRKLPIPHLSQDKEMTLDKLNANYKRSMQQWKSSKCRSELHRILDGKMPNGGWHIAQALCLATGSFSSDTLDYTKRAMLQWCAFEDTVEHIQPSSEDPIRMIAQEPA